MCNSCEALTINGVYCHEHGCPDAWKNKTIECKWCGNEFTPEEKEQLFVKNLVPKVIYLNRKG
jgi:hypothetical protein